jgi:protein-disulfide isomerase
MLGLAALLLIIGIRGGANAAEAGSQTQMVPMLPDRTLGDQNAPVNMIEYASLTCPHCAHFDADVFPELKRAYIDTGKLYYVFREMPGDGVALRAAMLARYVPKDHFFDFIHGLYHTQRVWADPALWNDRNKTVTEKLTPLATIAKEQAGISRDRFDMCMDDQKLMDQVIAQVKRGVDEFGVNETPEIYLNGRKFTGYRGTFASLDEELQRLLAKK